MPARARGSDTGKPARLDDPFADLAQLIAGMAPADVEAWSRSLPREDLSIVEQVMAEFYGAGWRKSPAAMAAHLDPEHFTAYRYMNVLASKYLDGLPYLDPDPPKGTKPKWLPGRSPRQIWNLPSRIGKTTLIRWCIAHSLDATLGRARWIYETYGDGLAMETGIAVRDILRQHADVLRAQLSPDVRRRDRFLTDEGGGLLCRGIDSGVIGFGCGDGGGMFIDDPMRNWQEAHSEAARAKVKNAFYGTLRHRLDQEAAPIFVVHARWHMKDLSGELLGSTEDETGEQWEHVAIPALAIEGRPDVLDREPGEPIEPERFTKADVHARHRALVSPHLVAAIEQQDPQPDEGIELLREWFVISPATEVPTAPDLAISSWDLKLKDKEAGDYVVGQVWWRVGTAYWLMGQIRGLYDHATTANAIALLAVRHPEVGEHVIEAAGSADEVIPQLRRPIAGYSVTDAMAARLGMTDTERAAVELLRRTGMARLVPKPAKMDKSMRARSYIAPAAEAGNVRIPETLAGLPALIDEIAAFPEGEHDDQVDAMSQGLQRLALGEAKLSSSKGKRTAKPADPSTSATPVIRRAEAGPTRQSRITRSAPGRRLGRPR